MAGRMRHDCKQSGCYLAGSMFPLWILDGALEREGIRSKLGDVDGSIERKGYELKFEFKKDTRDLITAQHIMHTKLTNKGPVTTFVVVYQGQGHDVRVTHMGCYVHGRWSGFHPSSNAELGRQTVAWYRFADANPLPSWSGPVFRPMRTRAPAPRPFPECQAAPDSAR